MLRLYTFMISHYAEKARWTLDHKRVRYEERRLLPGPHLATIRRLGSKSSVPLLMHDGPAIEGSKEIIDYADERWPERSLTPDNGAERDRALASFEKWLDAELGQTLRRFFYFHALERRELAVYMFTHGGPWWGRLFYGIGYPQVAAAIRKMYRDRRRHGRRRSGARGASVRRLDEQLRGNRSWSVIDSAAPTYRWPRFRRRYFTGRALHALATGRALPERDPRDARAARTLSHRRARASMYREHRQ